MIYDEKDIDRYSLNELKRLSRQPLDRDYLERLTDLYCQEFNIEGFKPKDERYSPVFINEFDGSLSFKKDLYLFFTRLPYSILDSSKLYSKMIESSSRSNNEILYYIIIHSFNICKNRNSSDLFCRHKRSSYRLDDRRIEAIRLIIKYSDLTTFLEILSQALFEKLIYLEEYKEVLSRIVLQDYRKIFSDYIIMKSELLSANLEELTELIQSSRDIDDKREITYLCVNYVDKFFDLNINDILLDSFVGDII